MQFGGQTPLKLAQALENAGVPILGTSPDAIDLAEDRDRFKALIEQLGSGSRESGIARSPARGARVADEHRLPGRDPPVLCARRPRHGDRRTTRRSSPATSPTAVVGRRASARC